MKKISIIFAFAFYSSIALSQPGSQVFTVSGSFSVPIGITTVTVEMVGPGGNGGGNGGGGGGGGGYSSGTFAVTPLSTFFVQVGTAGGSNATNITTLGIYATAGGNGTSVVNPNIGGGGAGGVGSGGTTNRTGGNGGGGYWTYFGGGGGGAGGIGGNGTNGGNTVMWSPGNCLTPGGAGGASGGVPGGSGGKGAGFTDNNCTVTNPAVAGSIYGGGGGGGNGNGGAAQSGADGYVFISWNGCANPAAPTGNSSQTFCSGSVSDLIANGTSIQWYAAASGGSPLPPTTGLVNGTHYYATQTISGCESVTRFDVTVTIAPTNPPTGNSSQTFCSGSVGNLVATGTGIQWYSTAIGGSPLTPAIPLVNGTHYYATQTISGCESATRFDVTVTIAPTNPPTGNSSQTFCNGTVGNLAAIGTGIQWYSTAIGGSPLTPAIPLVNGTHYYATQTISGCESTTRLDVTVTIAPTNPPTGNATQSFCNGTVGDLIANGTAIQWYSSALGGSPIPAITPLINGLHYFASQTLSGCESVNRFDVVVTITTTNTATGNATQTICDPATVADLVATGTTIQWYAAPSGGTPLSSSFALLDGSHYYATQTISGCESSIRFDVTVSIITVATPLGLATQSFCNPATVADLTSSSASVDWFAAASGGTVLPLSTALVNGSHYFASQTSSGCESATRLDVTAIVTTVNISTSLNLLTITAAANPATYQWIDCDNGNQIISGAVNQSFTGTLNGNYAVIVTQNSCTDTSACVNITLAGIDRILENENYSFSPNPARDYLTINIKQFVPGLRFVLSDLTGKIVKSGKLNSAVFCLEISELPAGVYSFRIEDSFLKIFKILKQ